MRERSCARAPDAARRACYSIVRMWFASLEEKARHLEAEAFEAIGSGALDEAEARADALLAMGWSGGFEVKAAIAQQRGDLEAAERVLEEGVSRAASAWPLWQLLGIVRSDRGRYEPALEAFDRALACEGADAGSVRFNRAIARHRHGDLGGAWDDLEPILALPKAPPFAEDALALAADCLASMGRSEDAVALVRAAYDACDPEDVRRPRLAAELAVALDRAGAREEARPFFVQAARDGVATRSLLALGRRLAPIEPRAPRLHRLVVEAPHPAARGVLRVIEVVADDLEQALEASRPYLPEGARVDEHEDRGDAPEAAEAGVVWASGLVFFDEE